MPRLGIVIAALSAGAVISLIFKAIYPSVDLSPSLAFLFALAGLAVALGVCALRKIPWSKPK